MATHFNSLVQSVDHITDQLDASFAEDLKRNLELLATQLDIAIDTFEASMLLIGQRQNVQLLCSLDLNVIAKDGSVIRLTAMTKLKGPDNG